MRAKICILGNFTSLVNGQTIKTEIVTDTLRRQFGEDQVRTIDTQGGALALLKAPFQAFKALKNSQNVLIFPGENGLRVYAPLLFLQRFFFKDRRLHYVVIGAWLARFLPKRRLLEKMLKRFDGIYAETNTLRAALEARGFQNVYVMPNCKRLTVLSDEDLTPAPNPPYKLCTFARVNKEKGTETAVNVVERVNRKLGYVAYSLDIYGQVYAEHQEWFNELQSRFPAYVRYGGCVDSQKSVEVLREYFALLFPTHYFTEGIPGTIIDAYAAGIPVISAKWESYADVIDDGVTGICYDFDNEEQFEDILFRAAKDPAMLLELKPNCIRKATDYLPETAIRIIVDRLG